MKTAILSVFFTALVIFGVYKFLGGGRFVPKEFVEARAQGSIVADRVAWLSSASLQNLQKVSELEKNSQYQEAIDVVSQELARNKEARDEAIKLSNYLDQMAKLLSEIKPREARDKAAEAVGVEIQVINRLISYNEYLSNLFELLKAKFEGKIKNDNDRLKELLLLINQETNYINSLNKRFNEGMQEFDKLVS